MVDCPSATSSPNMPDPVSTPSHKGDSRDPVQAADRGKPRETRVVLPWRRRIRALQVTSRTPASWPWDAHCDWMSRAASVTQPGEGTQHDEQVPRGMATQAASPCLWTWTRSSPAVPCVGSGSRFRVPTTIVEGTHYVSVTSGLPALGMAVWTQPGLGDAGDQQQVMELSDLFPRPGRGAVLPLSAHPRTQQGILSGYLRADKVVRALQSQGRSAV